MSLENVKEMRIKWDDLVIVKLIYAVVIILRL